VTPSRSTAPSHAAARRSGAALLLALAALLVAPGSPPAASAHPLVTGITNLYEDAPLAFEHARSSGAQMVRIPLHWAGAVPAAEPVGWRPDDPADPNYRWETSDREVTRAVQAGLTPVLQLGGPPPWAERCKAPAVAVWAACDPDPAKLAAFATAAARRYSGQTAGLPRVQYWQALNEPNLTLFFFPQYDTAGKALSPDLYRDLINAFYAGVKAVDPSNVVLSAGLGPTAVRPWTIGPMSFARQLLCMRGNGKPRPAGNACGGGVHFDVFAIQPYTSGGPTHEGKVNDVQIGDLAKLQTLIKAADRAGRIDGMFKRTPLWITEFSWDTMPPDPGGLPMSIATRWTAEALHEAWTAGVSNFFWYSLRDSAPEPNRPFSETLESGLFFRGATLAQDEPKPVFYAFRFPFVAYPGEQGLSFWGRTPNSKGGKVTVQLRDGRRWRKAIVVRADRHGIFHGLAKTTYGSNRSGAARAHFDSTDSVPFSMRPVADFRHPPFG
jgi:hypothetical protein